MLLKNGMLMVSSVLKGTEGDMVFFARARCDGSRKTNNCRIEHVPSHDVRIIAKRTSCDTTFSGAFFCDFCNFLFKKSHSLCFFSYKAMENFLPQKYSIPVFIGDWSHEEQLQFHYALNYLFIHRTNSNDFYKEISPFVKSKSIAEIKMFAVWYFLSDIHNKNPWSLIEHHTFMKGFEIFQDDFVETKKYLPFRSLVDVHEYACRMLPQFSMNTDMLCYENIVQNSDLSIIATLTGSSECLYVPPAKKDIESMKLMEDAQASVCKHSSYSVFDFDVEPIPLCDLPAEEEILDDSSMEFLFETLFD